MAGDGGGGGGEGGDTGEGGGEGGGGLGVGEGEGGGGEGGGIGGGEGGGGGGVWALCAEDRRTGEYFPRSRALSSRICDGTVLRTMSSMLSTPTASSMAAWSLSRGPRWRTANLSLAARVAAADDICRGAPILPISARIAGWAKPRPSWELRILRSFRPLRRPEKAPRRGWNAGNQHQEASSCFELPKSQGDSTLSRRVVAVRGYTKPR